MNKMWLVYLLQGRVISVMIGVGYFTRTVSPLWCKFIQLSTLCAIELELHPLSVIKSYEETGRHTYFAMAVVASCALVLLLSLLVLYKRLAPIPKSSDLVVSATGKLSFDIAAKGLPSTAAWFHTILYTFSDADKDNIQLMENV